jgi:hypothetical protein
VTIDIKLVAEFCVLQVTAADKESQLRRGLGRIPQTALDAVLANKIEKVGLAILNSHYTLHMCKCWI